jgi:hypothetical protein
MLVFLLANWRWLIPTAAAAVLAIALGFSSIEVAHLKTSAAETAAAIAKQKADAQALIAAREKTIADLERDTAEHNDKLEADHAQQVRTIVDAHSAFERELTRKLHEQAGRGASCSSPGPSKTVDPGINPGLETGSVIVSADAARRLGARGREADETDAVMAECQAWALQHGR